MTFHGEHELRSVNPGGRGIHIWHLRMKRHPDQDSQLSILGGKDS